MNGAYSEAWWWWQWPTVGLRECCWCLGAFHWWYHEFTDVLLYIETEVFQHGNDPKHTSKATVAFL
ncbi:unnamed protein product, partial [Staurois parvus]